MGEAEENETLEHLYAVCSNPESTSFTRVPRTAWTGALLSIEGPQGRLVETAALEAICDVDRRITLDLFDGRGHFPPGARLIIVIDQDHDPGAHLAVDAQQRSAVYPTWTAVGIAAADPADLGRDAGAVGEGLGQLFAHAA